VRRGAGPLCWHTGLPDSLGGGFRCGDITGLNNDSSFERIIFQAN
jgi:hypothetical protein